MLTRQLFTYQLAPKPIQTVPFLDIEELLERQNWKKRPINYEEKYAIEKTMAFFDLVIIGKDIAEKSAKERIISANLLAINSYNIAWKAYQYVRDEKRDFLELVNTAINVLTKIYAGKRRIDKNNLLATKCFIKSISFVVFSQRFFAK